MNESILHSIWSKSSFNPIGLYSCQGERIEILNKGKLNTNSGPDFTNAKIRIGGQLWVGNIEIHVNASDWYSHNHQRDNAYDNVILHVVWNSDTEVIQSGRNIPTLELRKLNSLQNELFWEIPHDHRRTVMCHKSLDQIPYNVSIPWLDKMMMERVALKQEALNQRLNQLKFDWEFLLLESLIAGFGIHLNQDAFLSIVKSIKSSQIRKLYSNPFQLEALLFGQGRMLDSEVIFQYHSDLKKEYEYLCKKFKIDNKSSLRPRWLRLRPSGFPTIRLSQFVQLLTNGLSLSSRFLDCWDIDILLIRLEVSTSKFWKTHYTFQKISQKKVKSLSRRFKETLILNSIIPVNFLYAQIHRLNRTENLNLLLRRLNFEKNSITRKYDHLKLDNRSAATSQAFLNLFKNYCSKLGCLRCEIGLYILNRNT